ncbi:MAG: AAA family ATPase [Polyangiaceae bacterium]
MGHSEGDMDNRATTLAESAKDLLPVLRGQARRAFVLELTGTPKAGKTTSVNTLRSFFKECGYRVHLLNERAADCPLPMKGHFFFNAWTTATMLSEVLETYDTEVDLLILDRGFFDALIWLELQKSREQVTEEEREVFTKFVLLDRWRSLVDLTVAVSVDPVLAMRRENNNLVVRREGGVMNPDTLKQFNEALDSARKEHRHKFSILDFQPTAQNIREDNIALLELILPKVQAWADPEVAALSTEDVRAAFGSETFLRADPARQLLSHAEITERARSVLESDKSQVQLVACALPMHRGRYFTFRRNSKDEKLRAYGEYTLWKGTHVSGTGPILDRLEDCLHQRVRDDLHLANRLQPHLVGMAWHPDDNHVGVLYTVEVSDAVASSMKQKEFKRLARQATIRGDFRNASELLQGSFGLERWSKSYLESLP